MCWGLIMYNCKRMYYIHYKTCGTVLVDTALYGSMIDLLAAGCVQPDID